jgi:hypothetical protein
MRVRAIHSIAERSGVNRSLAAPRRPPPAAGSGRKLAVGAAARRMANFYNDMLMWKTIRVRVGVRVRINTPTGESRYGEESDEEKDEEEEVVSLRAR